MQTSEKAYPKVGPFTGSLGVDALAVCVPLIYFSQTAITFTKKVKVLWVTATTNFHSKSLAKYPTLQGDKALGCQTMTPKEHNSTKLELQHE